MWLVKGFLKVSYLKDSQNSSAYLFTIKYTNYFTIKPNDVIWPVKHKKRVVIQS